MAPRLPRRAHRVPLEPSPRRQLGFLQRRVDGAFFEPLPNDELERWSSLLEPQKLSSDLRIALEYSDNPLVVSAASAWEIATKWRLGKLQHARSVVDNYAMAKAHDLVRASTDPAFTQFEGVLSLGRP